MNSNSDYETKLRNEYAELKERYNKLCSIINKYYDSTLDFKLNCSINLLNRQADIMLEYLLILEVRAEMENVEL